MLEVFPEERHARFPSRSTFHPNRNVVSPQLTIVNVLCTQPEPKLPILMENNKNHQITLPEGRMGFLSLDVSDPDERKYQVGADKGNPLHKQTVE